MAPKFSLQSVLDYRHNRVELLEVELGRLMRDQQRSQTILDALHDSQARLLDRLGQTQQGEIDLFLVDRLRSSLKGVVERIIQQKLRLQELASQVSAKRQEVVEARQAEEALSILKEKELERFQADQAQQENRQQDDIYIARAYHRSGSPA
jgi:flagellar export protein FliJ